MKDLTLIPYRLSADQPADQHDRSQANGDGQKPATNSRSPVSNPDRKVAIRNMTNTVTSSLKSPRLDTNGNKPELIASAPATAASREGPMAWAEPLSSSYELAAKPA